jgi:hypothetical protein
MSSELSNDDITGQVEQAVENAQRLDGMKQTVLEQLRAQGHDIDGGTVFVAHTLNGQFEVSDLGEA